MGGAARAIEQGFFQRRIAESAYAQQKAVEAGEMVVVGVNRFTEDEPAEPLPVPAFAELEARQRARVVEARKNRDRATVAAALGALEAAAGGTAPLMPPILGALRSEETTS